MNTPYVGYGNDTLDRCPEAAAGDLITCASCGGTHPLEPPDSDPGDTGLLFYRCGDQSFLGAVRNRLVVGVKADVSGSL